MIGLVLSSWALHWQGSTRLTLVSCRPAAVCSGGEQTGRYPRDYRQAGKQTLIIRPTIRRTALRRSVKSFQVVQVVQVVDTI